MSEQSAAPGGGIDRIRVIQSARDGHWYVTFDVRGHNYRCTAPHWTKEEAEAEVERLRAAPETQPASPAEQPGPQ